MWQQVECSGIGCSFKFNGGHSHHSGASCAVCISCLCRYILPTANRWGPEVGERIWLLLAQTKHTGRVMYVEHEPPVDTGVFIRAKESDCQRFVNYPIELVACPQCSEMSVVLGFEDNDRCPECGQQSLEVSFVEY